MGGDRRADAETLRGVHLAHSRAIPFENLDPLRGTVPSLAPSDLIAKLVRDGRRGGYCYEHNTLFAAVLEALGLGVTLLTARVVVGAQRFEERPRTHMALLVEVPGEPRPCLADVGFGAPGALLEPVPLTADVEFRGAGRRHRLVHAPHRGPLELWVLETHLGTRGTRGEQGSSGEDRDGDWQAQYAFTLEPFERSDYEVINWHIATNPRSPFGSRAYVQRLTPTDTSCSTARSSPRATPTAPSSSANSRTRRRRGGSSTRSSASPFRTGRGCCPEPTGCVRPLTGALWNEDFRR